MPHPTVTLAGVGLVATAVLWLAGRFVPLPSALLGTLLGFAALGGVAGLLAPAAAGTLRTPAKVAGALELALVGVFLLAVFHVGSGPVSVKRHAATSSDGAEPPERLRLVVFNVLHDHPRFLDQEARAGHLEAALRALRPDVVMLQEAWSVSGRGDLTARLAAALDMDAAFARANGSRPLIGFEEGCAVLSRLPIADARRLALRPRRPWFEGRVALEAVLELGGGARLRTVSTHLSHRGTAVAAAQARDLVARLSAGQDGKGGDDEGPIVGGDLNDRSDGPATQVFLDRGLRDVLPGGIDHLLVPAEGFSWRVVDARWTLLPDDLERLIGERATISDHPAIVVDLLRAPN